MTESVIIGGILRIVSFFKNAYLNSGFRKVFERFDEALKTYALNSRIIKFFIKERDCKVPKDSRIYSGLQKMASFAVKVSDKIRGWILGSCAVEFFKNVIAKAQNKPFRMLGVFGTVLMASNLIFSAVVGAGSFLLILAKLALLLGFIVISSLEVDFKELLNTSKAFWLFKWFISYED